MNDTPVGSPIGVFYFAAEFYKNLGIGKGWGSVHARAREKKNGVFNTINTFDKIFDRVNSFEKVFDGVNSLNDFNTFMKVFDNVNSFDIFVKVFDRVNSFNNSINNLNNFNIVETLSKICSKILILRRYLGFRCNYSCTFMHDRSRYLTVSRLPAILL